MKITVSLLLIILFPALLSAQSDLNANIRPLVFNHATIIDVKNAASKPGMTVIVNGNRISAIGKTGKIRIPRDSEVIDARNKFLIPGLWDMHVHVDDASAWMFPLFIANGVVGVRDMGSNLKQISVWREMSKSGALMPRIMAAGPIVSGKIADNDPRMLLIESKQESIKAVEQLKSEGVNFIKIHDWISRKAYLTLIEEAKKKNSALAGHQPVSMTATEISNLGQKSVEHFGNAWGGLLIDCSNEEASLRRRAQTLIPLTRQDFNPPKLMTALGEDWNRQLVDSFSVSKAEKLARVFRRNGTWFDPIIFGTAYAWTFVKQKDVANDPRLKYMPAATQKAAKETASNTAEPKTDPAKIELEKRLYQTQLKLVRIMKRAGVGILAGTDALPFPPLFPGFSLHDELEKLVEAGLSPAEALRAATVNPARFFGREGEFGTIEMGKNADLVLLDGNPLSDISNSRKIAGVLINGRFLRKNSLEKMLAEVETAHKN